MKGLCQFSFTDLDAFLLQSKLLAEWNGILLKRVSFLLQFWYLFHSNGNFEAFTPGNRNMLPYLSKGCFGFWIYLTTILNCRLDSEGILKRM